MSQLDPNNTTAGDLCSAALRECGAFGIGTTPLAADISDTQARLQWMLQEWERKRWLVYHLVNYGLVSTGKTAYTVGPNGDINTSQIFDPFTNSFSPAFGGGTSARPARVESAFLRQLTQSQPNQIDYPLTILESREDYDRIQLKQLQSFPQYVFYDAAWPQGLLHTWPVPQANIYGVYISVMEQLPAAFPSLSVKLNLPFEYYNAIVQNLALRLRPKYSIPTYPGDLLPGFAKDALNALRGSNTRISRLRQPKELLRNGLYNIFSDQNY